VSAGPPPVLEDYPAGTGVDDFATIFEGAMDEIRAPDPAVWTDHNRHDPGITLLEAALYALADLDYRIDRRAFEGWPYEVRDWRGRATARGDHEIVDDFLAVPANLAAARGALATATSRMRAVVELASVDFHDADGAAFRLTPGAARAIVDEIREPYLRRAALDRSGPIEQAVAGAADAAAARAALTRLLEDLRLWPEEIGALIEGSRRRRLVRLLREHSDRIREIVDESADAVSALATLQLPFDEPSGNRLTLTADEAKLAMGQHPAPPAAPERWEDAQGRTALWPPHPLQTRTCEPVTAEDYRRLALNMPGVKRAWVVPGLAGINWKGDVKASPRPYRRGALTVLVQTAAAPRSYTATVNTTERNLLRGLLRHVLARSGTDSEVDMPYPDYRADFDRQSPRRLLGDEVGAALVRTYGVVVRGTLEIEPSVSEELVLAEADRLLDGFLSADRVWPGEAPPAPPQPLDVPDELEGPWPDDPHVRAFLADPGAVHVAGGWPPREPVRASEVVQLLHELPGVVGVIGLALQRAGASATDWHQELPAPAGYEGFCLPSFARHCLCISVVETGECGDA
jgi:hypothetical protein